MKSKKKKKTQERTNVTAHSGTTFGWLTNPVKSRHPVSRKRGTLSAAKEAPCQPQKRHPVSQSAGSARRHAARTKCQIGFACGLCGQQQSTINMNNSRTHAPDRSAQKAARGARPHAAPRHRFEWLRRSAAALGAVRVNGIERDIEEAEPRSQAREHAQLSAPITRQRQFRHVACPHRPPPLRHLASGAPVQKWRLLRRIRGRSAGA